MKSLLIYSPLSWGGIADYTHDQANAFVDAGVEVTVLCAPDFQLDRNDIRYGLLPKLLEERPREFGGSRLLRQIRLAACIVFNVFKLSNWIRKRRVRYVLLSYSEYMSPFWAGWLVNLKRRGVVFGVILHDPVRNYQVGPKWWHQYSIRRGYDYVSNVYVHGGAGSTAMTGISTHSLVFGTRPSDRKNISPNSAFKKRWNIPESNRVLLAFGHIRDNKNLDLMLQALKGFPELSLVVAGQVLGGGNRPVKYYQKLAHELGCQSRCIWIDRHIETCEVAEIFGAADLAVLTYSREFHSASSALSMVTAYELPCLASGAENGSMGVLIRKYGLGIWVEADSESEISRGLDDWLSTGVNPDWENYFRDHSWERNVEVVMNTMKIGEIA